MKKFVVKTLILLILWTVFNGLNAAQLAETSCTSWASIGDKNAGGGLIIAKNRDSEAAYEELKIVHPKQGNTYLGLFYSDTNKKPYPYIAAGVNDKNLYIVQNEATSQPFTSGYSDSNQSKLIFSILQGYSSVEEVLINQDKIFKNSAPNFLIIGDNAQAILVEIGTKKNQFEIRTAAQNDGILYHTNHYVLPSLVNENTLFYLGSQRRFSRIKHLMTHERKPYNFQIARNWSNDQKDGYLLSIFREFTVASWIALLPKNGTPFLWVRFTSPKVAYQTYRLDLTKEFWKHNGVINPITLKELKIPSPVSTDKKNYNQVL